MSCGNCGNGSSPKGCNNNGGCSTGSCNRLNTFDWLAATELDPDGLHNIVEVSFKHGTRKDFFAVSREGMLLNSGDMVVVESGAGNDVGRVSLTGALVKLQMKKKKVREDRLLKQVRRLASSRDLERLEEARAKERDTLVRARAMARTLNLDMKISEVEFQGDGRKATFYFTANSRVDFRELIRQYAREFKVKVEMRQIGARQESSLIGGLGSCGRELCCSTWLTSFKNVSTKAARYQNLSINQSKLSGQCGRLKCCLNYELDVYIDAVKKFPKADKLKTQEGMAYFIKVDIFKKLMYYNLKLNSGRSHLVGLDIESVREIKKLNKQGEFPESFKSYLIAPQFEEPEVDFDADLTGSIVLKDDPKRRRRGGKRKNRNKKRKGRGKSNQNKKK
ncbi:MAG: hypothetical protein KTR24_10755 [Saprospiraceae bacterium]|nr:hypothetical protein [Saprospiraceae bacterium]